MPHATSQSQTLRDFEIVVAFAATGESGSGAVVMRSNGKTQQRSCRGAATTAGSR